MSEEISKQLDLLLNESQAQLRAIEQDEYKELAPGVVQHRIKLQEFMKRIASEQPVEMEMNKLLQIRDNHLAGMKLVSDKKQMLAGKVTELRNGRSLANTYSNHL